ncbi:hypothetical protein C2134_00540 [Chromobacterium sinusclupearum]|uniref:Transposase IS4-like domain-containing protein n=1 Tax=Chromobacterium sinusclupearum TaxID=2077146 RepID=A0A2K4MUD7_9NEIS|nr:hypothetical protein C2134_00540 [Chromobacterium sinusclupearum]
MLKQGTIVDATLIHAPSSTKNAQGERDPDMHQTRKGNQWYFGMKAHVGVDAQSGLVHHVAGTAGNVADVTMVDQLLRRGSRCVWRRRLYWRAQASRTPIASGALVDCDEARPAQSADRLSR